MQLLNRDIAWNPLSWPWVSLLLLGLLFLGLSLWFPQLEPWTGRLSMGLVSTWLGFSLIERQIKVREQRDVQKRRDIALNELSGPMQNYLHLLLSWYKVALPESSDCPPKSLQQLLSEDYYEVVKYLDFYADTPHLPPRTWLEHSASEMSQLKNEIDSIVKKYSQFIDPELMGALQEIRDSKLMKSLISIHRSRPAIQAYSHDGEVAPLLRDYKGQHKGHSRKEPLNDHIDAILSIVDIFKNSDSAEIPMTDGEITLTGNGWVDIGSARYEFQYEEEFGKEETDEEAEDLEATE